jgi:hypothetical protein
VIPKMEMMDVNMTMLEVKQFLFSKIKYIFPEGHPIHKEETQEAELARCISLHIYDNLPMVKDPKYYYKTKAQCEFCRQTHGLSPSCDVNVRTE